MSILSTYKYQQTYRKNLSITCSRAYCLDETVKVPAPEYIYNYSHESTKILINLEISR